MLEAKSLSKWSVQNILDGIQWIKKHGFINLLLWVGNQRIYSLGKTSVGFHQETSISDDEAYNAFCLEVSNVNRSFRRFRRFDQIIRVLDHVGIEHAYQYLHYVRANSSQDFMPLLRKLDSVGSPRKYWFRQVGLISPTGTRYLKVWLEVQRLFGHLHNLTIAEIGVGFGGQALIFSELSAPRKYILLDIPPALSLASKYLHSLRSQMIFESIDGRNPLPVYSDLVISNYAFSELKRELQEMYLVRVISNASRGYITWNVLSEKHLDGFSLDEVLERIPSSRKLPEIPETSPGNVIIVWDRS